MSRWWAVQPHPAAWNHHTQYCQYEPCSLRGYPNAPATASVLFDASHMVRAVRAARDHIGLFTKQV